jgi:WD40 repeat protein
MTVRIWKAETEQLVWTFQGHFDSVWSLAALPSGLLASGLEDGVIKLHNVDMGQEVRMLAGRTGPVYSLLDLLGWLLASGAMDSTWRSGALRLSSSNG